MYVAIDFDKGTATMTISEFWSGLNELLAQADAHAVDSRDEDSGHLHRDRDACMVREHLETGKPLWPLIERDITQDAALDAKLRHALEIREGGRGPLNGETSIADINGGGYVRIGGLHAGRLMKLDDGHSCVMPDQAVRQVKCGADGQLAVQSGEYCFVEDEGVIVGIVPMNRELTGLLDENDFGS
jgi:hypothetical protein